MDVLSRMGWKLRENLVLPCSRLGERQPAGWAALPEVRHLRRSHDLVSGVGKPGLLCSIPAAEGRGLELAPQYAPGRCLGNKKDSFFKKKIFLI